MKLIKIINKTGSIPLTPFSKGELALIRPNKKFVQINDVGTAYAEQTPIEPLGYNSKMLILKINRSRNLNFLSADRQEKLLTLNLPCRQASFKLETCRQVNLKLFNIHSFNEGCETLN